MKEKINLDDLSSSKDKIIKKNKVMEMIINQPKIIIKRILTQKFVV